MTSKILIVDDSIMAAQALKTVIDREERYEAFVIHDGSGVLQAVADYDIDVILLDALMPDMDAYDVLKLLKDNDDTKNIPVIVITGLTYAAEVRKAIKHGAMDCIRKTSEPIEVIAKLNSAVTIKNQHDRLLKTEEKDTMTNLYNKLFFNRTIDELLKAKDANPKGVALLAIDTDSFRKTQREYGHLFGDEVIIAMARTIESFVKPEKDFVCRLGWDEFFAILPDVSPYMAFVLAEKLRKSIAASPFKVDGKDVKETVSIGIGHAGKGENKTDSQLVNEADDALHRAKENGRNQTIYFGSVHAKKSSR
ncbi:MAG: diguanylate cyclase [Defluviitaleaceae bacterium]|nr:diguanylate cyclase [Defluviitaleaceae bacterium]MCL2261748.1 diguanylate cyclase [Defluviitaleaceae bacterium]